MSYIGSKRSSSLVSFDEGTIGSGVVFPTFVGMIAAFATSSPPTGWLACQGQTLDSTTDTEYSPLFTVIGTTWGGTGSSSFLLPDLRGEFLRGWDNGRGVDSGRAFASAQSDAFQGHYHQEYTGNIDRSKANTVVSGTGNWPSSIGAANNTPQGGAAYIKEAKTDGTNGTPRTASETRSRNISILFCIRWK